MADAKKQLKEKTCPMCGKTYIFREHYVKKKAETGVMFPQAKEQQILPVDDQMRERYEIESSS